MSIFIGGFYHYSIAEKGQKLSMSRFLDTRLPLRKCFESEIVSLDPKNEKGKIVE